MDVPRTKELLTREKLGKGQMPWCPECSPTVQDSALQSSRDSRPKKGVSGKKAEANNRQGLPATSAPA